MLLDVSKRPLMFIRPRSADKIILEEALGLYQGLHVSATSPQFMTDFVRELGKPFIIDPMVYIFSLRPKQLLDKKKGTIKPSINTLGCQYGSLYQQSAGKRSIIPTDFSTPLPFAKPIRPSQSSGANPSFAFAIVSSLIPRSFR